MSQSFPGRAVVGGECHQLNFLCLRCSPWASGLSLSLTRSRSHCFSLCLAVSRCLLLCPAGELAEERRGHDINAGEMMKRERAFTPTRASQPPMHKLTKRRRHRQRHIGTRTHRNTDTKTKRQRDTNICMYMYIYIPIYIYIFM